jgi:DNA-binding GntR family transcriptional regulator
MGPIDKRTTTLAERAYDRIAAALLSGEIRPGERLVMDQLAERLDISRTPVRDALRRLAGEGLVEPSSNRGYIVRQVSDKDVDELYEAREAIESFAARRVAEIGTLAIDEVRAEIVSMRKLVPVDAEDAFRANLAIHRSFVAATGNPMLLDMFDEVWQRARGQSLFADFVAHDTGGTNGVRPAHRFGVCAGRRPGRGLRSNAEAYRRRQECPSELNSSSLRGGVVWQRRCGS